jgi:hypothetical protein
MSLWLPILLSAVAVFIISSIIHMVLGYHANDYKGLPTEKQIMDDLRKHNLQPGDYHFPHVTSIKDLSSPDFIEKMKQGPVGYMTIMKSGPPNMVKELAMWFMYSIIVGFCAAYVASRAVDPGEGYLTVLRFAGVTSFLGYSLALLQNSIWYKRNWSATLKSMFDGLIYALFTAGIFGWLWPTI